MMWSTSNNLGVTETKLEENSYHRAREGKILGRDYKRFVDRDGSLIHMGSLDLVLSYKGDTLTVVLHRARNIGGKQSQDPYAQVFLIEERPPPYQGVFDPNQKVIVNKGHERTKTFDKNLNPEFQNDPESRNIFKFKMDSLSLFRKSLVISIWDEDSKSRDDFMAGVTFSLRELARFAKLGIQVSVDLQVQEKDGYPMRLKDSDIIRLFGPLQSITSDWDLKECNNRLVTYIDRARVLRQAYELKQGLPSSLSTRTSVIVQSESSTFLIQQMDKIRTMLADVKRRRAEKENTRQKVKDEMERQERRYRTQVETIRKRQETLDSLAQEEAKLRCRECSGSSLIKYYGSAAQVPSRSVHPWPSIHAEELRLTGLQFDRIDVDSYRRDEREKLIIKIKTEFHEKFLAALNEARMNYKKKGVMEIEIEEDIMKIYQKIIKDRAEQNGTRYSLDGLHKLWNGRNYQARIQQLLTDIESLKSRIHGAEGRGAGERADWEREMRSLNAALDAALARLREMMGSLSVFNVTSETQLDEVAMYQQLLQFETLRLQRPASHYRATVTQRTVRGGGGVSGAGFSRTSFSGSTLETSTVESGTGRGRFRSMDSGVGVTPEGTLERGLKTFDFDLDGTKK